MNEGTVSELRSGLGLDDNKKAITLENRQNKAFYPRVLIALYWT